MEAIFNRSNSYQLRDQESLENGCPGSPPIVRLGFIGLDKRGTNENEYFMKLCSCNYRGVTVQQYSFQNKCEEVVIGAA